MPLTSLSESCGVVDHVMTDRKVASITIQHGKLDQVFGTTLCLEVRATSSMMAKIPKETHFTKCFFLVVVSIPFEWTVQWEPFVVLQKTWMAEGKLGISVITSV